MFILMHQDNKIGTIRCYLSVLSTFRTHFLRGLKVRFFLFAAMRGTQNGYRTSTGESNRSMCDDSILGISGQEVHKTDIAHRLANRIGRCAIFHLVIFWPREYSRFSLNGISIGAHLRILMVIRRPCVIAGKYQLERIYCTGTICCLSAR